MMKAVRFDHYGDVEVLDVREVDDPVAAPGRVVVRVRAAAANPGDNYVREGLAEQAWALRARLSGQASDVPACSAADNRIDAFIDTIGADYVDLAHELNVPAQRINTVVDFQAAIHG